MWPQDARTASGRHRGAGDPVELDPPPLVELPGLLEVVALAELVDVDELELE